MGIKHFFVLVLFLEAITIYSQQDLENYIIFNNLQPFEGNEYSFVKKKIISQTADDYLYIIYLNENDVLKEILYLKKCRQVILYNNEKDILFFGKKDYGDEPYPGEPLFHINGENGTIESFGNFWPGFFLVEGKNVIINRLKRNRDSYSTDDILIYDIISKEVICIYDINKYLISKLGLEKNIYYELDFPCYYDGKIKLEDDDCIGLYFNRGGEDGPNSFYAHLDIKDIRNVYIEDAYK